VVKEQNRARGMNKKSKILIIDDEKLLCETLSDFLLDSGYDTVMAFDGEQGIEEYRKENPDIVLLDLSMPKMSGYEVLEKLLEHNPDFPVIVVSGVGAVDKAMKSISMGAWDFITKPVLDMEVLLHQVEKALDRSRLIQMNKKYQEHLEDEVRKRTAALELEIREKKQAEKKYRTLFESANSAIILLNELHFFDCNRKTLEMFAVTKDDLLGKTPLDLSPQYQSDGEKSSARAKLIMEKMHSDGEIFTEWDFTRSNGEVFPSEVSFSTLKLDNEEYLVAIVRDITDRRRAEEELRKFSLVIDQNPAMVMITDPDGVIEYVNPKFTEVTGYKPAEAIGKKPSILKSGMLSREFYRELWETIKGGETWRGEFHNRKKNGKDFWEYASISSVKNHDGSIRNFVAIMEDITVHKEYEDKLFRQANYDSLTELPNRVLLLDRLSQGIQRAARYDLYLVLMLLDVNDFKIINDTKGHQVGDDMLKEVAHRLRKGVRASDTVARFSGDKFFIVVPELIDPVEAEMIAEKLLTSIEAPFFIHNDEFNMSATIGMTVFPNDGDSAEILMRNADAALYHAKGEGASRFRFFSRELNDLAISRIRMETLLRHAVEKNELSLYYQPQISISSGRVVGAECLLRWKNDELGMVPPDSFIPVAEDTGLITGIGEYVMIRACKEAAQWKEVYDTPLTLAINVSYRQFRNDNFIERFRSIIEESPFPRENLEIEITESMLVDEVDKMIAMLNEIVNMDITVSIDDFGTGYSSLSYLKRFPIHTLKIDKSFIRNLPGDQEDVALSKAIIAMAHSLGMKVVAEGVETAEQLQFLHSLGCDIAQGYYYSKPIPSDEFLSFLGNRNNS